MRNQLKLVAALALATLALSGCRYGHPAHDSDYGHHHDHGHDHGHDH